MSAPHLRVTFLGHQGWALDAGGPMVLVDPLLCEGIGDEPEPYLELFPPRRFDEAAAPAVAGVLLTHEHPDHFHLPSLAKLPRSVPVWLSANASSAARTALSELGFAWTAFGPGARAGAGGVELLALRPDGRTRDDEWDVMPFVARDLEGHGAFLSTIDLSLTAGLMAEVKALEARPGVWAVANNDMNLSALYPGMPAGDRVPEIARAWGAQLEQLDRAWGPVQRALIYGGGFSFPGALSWLNGCAFDVPGERLAQLLGPRFHAALPGDAVRLTSGRASAVEPCGWLAPKPVAEWPAHGVGGAAPAPVLEPAAPLSGPEWRELEGALDGFARALYGGPVFERLLRLAPADVAPARPEVAFVLHDGAETKVRAYDPRAARFVPSQGAPEQFAACVEAHARTALEALTVSRTPAYTVFGKMRFHQVSGARGLDVDMALYVYLHPLRHPDAFLAAYRRQLGQVRQQPVFRAPGAR